MFKFMPFLQHFSTSGEIPGILKLTSASYSKEPSLPAYGLC